MRVIVNALSVTNESGRHVVLGHLERLAAWTAGEHDYVVLHHGVNADIRRGLGSHVDWLACPDSTAHWLPRALWQRWALPRLVRRCDADLVFSPSGVATPGLPVPEVVYCMNPWCLVPDLDLTAGERIKAALQRRAYRHAVKTAAMMGFLSEYLRDAYLANAGADANASEVAYCGINETVLAAAEALRTCTPRKPNQILCVSSMARHKGVDVLLRAVAAVRRDHDVDADLTLAGGWPDPTYERAMRALIHELGLDNAVEVAGHVSRDRLDKLYAESKVFCLMSRCESFGIPAAEAQAFGCPVVSSSRCAIPEVCGAGGEYPDADDVPGTAAALARLLEDQAHWRKLSDAAIENSGRFRWDLCSRPLLRMFELAGATER